MTGRISVLVSRDLQTLIQAAESLDREVAAQNRKHTRANAEPIWKDEVAARAVTPVQARVLARTARVAVSNTNVTMKAAHIGKTGHGTPSDALKAPAEFGAHADKRITQRSRSGTRYQRRLGKAFSRPRARGYAFFPSVAESGPRLVSLWMQTTMRTVAEVFERAGA